MKLGTKQVLGTLWPIDDPYAYDLTRRFYDQANHQQSSPSKALQSAQKAWGDKHSTARCVFHGKVDTHSTRNWTVIP